MEMYAESNVPQLSYALVSINNIPMSELFEATSTEELAEFNQDPKAWRIQTIARWLINRPTNIVETLWLEYLKLKDRFGKAMQDVENLSKRTPSGA